jgi:hypothetical protein
MKKYIAFDKNDCAEKEFDSFEEALKQAKEWLDYYYEYGPEGGWTLDKDELQQIGVYERLTFNNIEEYKNDSNQDCWNVTMKPLSKVGKLQ